MISKKTKGQKGVTLVALVITVTIILILTGAIIYNVRKNISIHKLTALQNDIMNLRDKVSSYYGQYGALPIVQDVEYTNISKIRETGVISEAVDTGNFYVIKLSSLDNLTLTYGEDFEKISKNEATTAEQINGLEDLYIVNADSHNIFYAGGVTVDNQRFHTDYTQDNIDTASIPIVEVVIKPGLPNDDGIFTENSTINGEEGTANNPTIPAGFKPIDTDTSKWGDGSNPPTEEAVKNGLVIQDESGNEFVWIPVPVLNEFARLQDGSTENYRGVLYNFNSDPTQNTEIAWSATSTDYGEPANLSNSYDSTDKNSSWNTTLYQSEYNKMVSSVSQYKGFYVGRYEMSVSNDTKKIAQSKKDQTSANASQEDTSEWYGLYNKAKTYAPEKNSEGKDNTSQKVVSSMIWGSQYDAMLRWMQKNSIDVTAMPDNTKRTSTRTTGGNENDILNNVYDIYWNSYEWTQEANYNCYRVIRRRLLQR